MSKSIEEMYNELMAHSNLEEDKYSNKEYLFSDDDDDEDFFTSKEIISRKEELKERLNISGIDQPVEIEEDVYFKRYTKRREHKYTEKEMREIEASCETSIVHDYGPYDIYHMSDEERANNDMLSELNMKLGCLKRTYRKVDEYIKAMRIVVQAWEILEKNNFVHTKDEFFQLVSEGKIVSNRIIMPKLKRMDRYNIDLIIKYISNPELDPKDLSPSNNNSLEDEYDSELDEKYERYMNEYIQEHENEFESYELRNKASAYAEEQINIDEMERLLSPEEAQYIIDHADNPESFRVKDIKPKYIKGYDKRNITKFNGKKKKMNKTEKYITENLHDMLIRIQTNPNLNSSGDYYSQSYMLTNSMFEPEKESKDVFDDMKFHGSWADDDAVYLYDLSVREELLKQHPPKESYLTYADKELSQFFKILEDNGVNTIDLRRKMNCTDDDNSKKKILQEKKENKKIESALLQRITELNKNKKFKKIVSKAEKELQKYEED